jgi:EpsI family protein
MDRPTQTDATPVDAKPQQRNARARATALLSQPFLVAVAAAAAYRELLWYAPSKSLSEEVEQLFFLPSQGVAPLVVLLSGWLLYRRASRLRSLPPAQAPWLGSALLGAAATVYLWATLTGAPDLLVPSLGMAGLGVAALWKGRAALRVVLVPVLFLLFAMPLPAPLLNEVVFRLQIATADLTGVFLSLLRIPHHISGDQILGTSQTFSVIESCSGLRSIETLTMVAILMADLFGRRWPHALLLVLAAPPIAFLWNGGRAVALILNPYSQLATVHNAQGVVMLLGGVVLLFLLDGLIESVARGVRARRPTGASVHSPRASAPQADPQPARRPALAGAVALLGGLALAAALLPRFEVLPPEGIQLASGLGNLLSRPVPTDSVFLGSAGFRDVATLRFERGGHSIDVFLGVGWRQGRARSALSPKTAAPGSGWMLESEQPRVLQPDARVVRQLVFRSGSQTVLAYHWYEGATGLASETMRTFLALDASPFRRARDILAIRATTRIEGPLSSGLEPAAARLDALYAELRRAIDRLPAPLDQAGGKAFPDFPVWVNFFRPTSPSSSGYRDPNQVLSHGTDLGMRLAISRAEAGGDRMVPRNGAYAAASRQERDRAMSLVVFGLAAAVETRNNDGARPVEKMHQTRGQRL